MHALRHSLAPHSHPLWPAQHSFKSLLETHWRNKTVVFVGDSINALVFNAALCESAKTFRLHDGGGLSPAQQAENMGQCVRVSVQRAVCGCPRALTRSHVCPLQPEALPRDAA